MPPTRSWENDPLVRKAVRYILRGESYQKAYQRTGVSRAVTKRIFLEVSNNPDLKKKYTFIPKQLDVIKNKKTIKNEVSDECKIFTPEQEMTLLKCIKKWEYLFYGLSNKECRMLAYQMVVNEDMKIPEGWKNGMASNDWLISFKRKNSKTMNDLQKPDRLCTRLKIKKNALDSSNQNLMWEKKTTNEFYDRLEIGFKKYPEVLNNKRVFSLDETFTSTNPNTNIVGRDTKLDLVTTCCIICADGTSLPPVIVKPYSDVDSSEVPRPSEFIASRGRLTTDLFTEVMHHFVKHSRSTPSNSCILIMDTDLCHLSSAALNLADDSGVYVLTLNPHMNNLLQPLHGPIFDSFQKYCYDSIDSWAGKSSKAKVPLDVVKIIRESYAKAMTPESIENAFKRCGISPFDRDLFTDSEYSSCLNQIDNICIECKMRDDRFKYLASGTNYDDTKEPEDSLEDKTVVEEAGPSSHHEEIHENVQDDSAGMSNLPPPPQPSQDLDKLKRRLIRSVARLIKEKKTEEEVWNELKKECGNNCKALWVRMRSLTLKKLKRLLDADDRVEQVPAVARMTLTDWLLYDLVLVHEKIDVINRASQKDSKVLDNLFTLVQRFQIEGRQGDDLAEAWTAATVSYNSKGHQCSPMLMQRRWYQIKELTRHKLYKFWFNYRGNEKFLLKAKSDEPTPLQRAISSRYPEIITSPFPSWDQRIEQKLVIMPEEFEVKMRKKVLMKPSDDAVPDVVVVEKKIDTITIDSDSEFSDVEKADETQNTDINFEKDNSSLTPVIVQVKSEPPDINITDNPTYTEERPVDKFQQAIESVQFEEDRILTVMPYITNVTGASDRISIENDPGVSVTHEKEIVHSKNNTVVNENELGIGDDNSLKSIVIDDDDDAVSLSNLTQDKKKHAPKLVESVAITTKSKAKATRDEMKEIKAINTYSHRIVDNITKATEQVLPIITAVAGGPQVQAKMEINKNFNEHVEKEDEILSDSHENEDIVRIEPEAKDNVDLATEIITETNFDDDGIEFADDGIEENNDHNESNKSSETPENNDAEDSDINAPKIDLKLLMNPVVYTTKLDDMTVFKGKSIYDTICKKNIVDKVIIESKPDSAKSIKVMQINADDQHLEVDNVPVKVENAQEFDDDLFQNESSIQNDIIESKRVKLSSSLLQKPKSRNYHPIQLCKNPDFNMRLKRLTMGFFSHERNRVFLKACKPMTIDLSKAFEAKLVDGTMYLKSSDTVVKKEADKVYDNRESAVSVQPSAVAVQSLIDNPDVDKILQEELEKRMLERNKTINLPHISLVRQINQHLLMAEVAPIMAQAEKSAQTQTLTVQDVIETVVEGNKLGINVNINENLTQTPTNIVKETLLATNTDKLKEGTMHQRLLNQSVPLLPMMQSKSSDETNTEKQKKKRYQVNRPSWLTKFSKQPKGEMVSEDTLLTLDTLYKVLNALDPTSVPSQPKTKNKSMSLKEYRTQSNLINEAQNPIDTVTNFPKPELCLTDNAEQSALKNNTGISVRCPRGRPKKYCCWARAKIIKLKVDSKVSLMRHKCKDRCKCCCRENLRLAEIDDEIKILEKMQNRDTYVDTIEQVVQQSRDISNAPESINLNRDSNLSVVQSPANASEDVSLQANYYPCANTYNTSPNADPQNNIEPAIISKNTEPEQTINIDDDDNGNDVSVVESEHELQPPKPIIRVYSGSFKHVPGTKIEQPLPINTLDRESNTNCAVAPSPIVQTLPSTPVASTPPVQPVTIVAPMLSNISKSIQAPKATVSKRKITKKVKDKESQITNLKNITKEQEPLEIQEARPGKEQEGIPCSCLPNVVQHKSSAMLIVDGSSQCMRHTTPRVSKETRIYLSRKHLYGTERPFFVGKNKILLTNIKPPRLQTKAADTVAMPVLPVVPSPVTTHQSMPLPLDTTISDAVTLDIPTGVQIVLLPDGLVSYVVDPDVQLTQKQINEIPLILQVVKTQISANGIAIPVNDTPLDKNIPPIILDNETTQTMENIDLQIRDQSLTQQLSGEVVEQKDETSVTENQIESQEDFQKDEENNIRKTIEKENTSKLNKMLSDEKKITKDVPDIEIDSIKATGSVLDVNNHTIEGVENAVQSTEINKVAESISAHPKKAVENITENSENIDLTTDSKRENTHQAEETDDNRSNTPASSSRNLLSDLMEMSGILEEDITPIQSEVMPVLTPVSGSTVHSVARPLSPLHQITAKVSEKTYDLNPIISFSELKYACENSGLFFKLDLNTGVIVPINVCIQKTPDTGSKIRVPEVIDLTDEPSVSTNEPKIIKDGPEKMIRSSTEAKNETVAMKDKIKLKKLYSIIQKRYQDRQDPYDGSPLALVEQKKLALVKKLSNNLKPLKLLHQNRTINTSILQKNAVRAPRKQDFRQIIASRMKNRVDVRIDLVDSDTPMEEEYLEDSSEDSDDEPLAKVAKKMRENETLQNLQGKSGETASELFETINETSKTVDEPVQKIDEPNKALDKPAEGMVEPDEAMDEPGDSMDEFGDAVDDTCEAMDVDNHDDFETAIGAVDIPVSSNSLLKSNNTNLTHPVPTQLMLSGPTVTQPILLNALLTNNDEEDDSEDICILGV